MLISFFKSAQQIRLTAILFLLRFLMSISFATTKSHIRNIVSVTNMSPLFSYSKHSIPGTKSNLQTHKHFFLSFFLTILKCLLKRKKNRFIFLLVPNVHREKQFHNVVDLWIVKCTYLWIHFGKYILLIYVSLDYWYYKFTFCEFFVIRTFRFNCKYGGYSLLSYSNL
jgi:hypothetical protein